jgi:hypothetical protein
MVEGKDKKAAAKLLGSQILSIYNRDYRATLQSKPLLLKRIFSYVIGHYDQPEDPWTYFVEEKIVWNKARLYIWKEPLFALYLQLRTKSNEDGGIVWSDDRGLRLPLADISLLLPLHRFIKHDVEIASFNEWYQNWPKGNQLQLDALLISLLITLDEAIVQKLSSS